MALSPLKRLGKLPFVATALLAAQAALGGTLTNVSVVPDDASPGATTNYTFTYTLEQDVNADEALFYVTFPDGVGEFSVATGACDRIASITLNPVPMGGAAICRASYGSGNTVGLAVNTSVGGGVSVPGGTEVEIVVSGVTNPAVAGDYNFDHGDGTGIITTQMMDPMFPMVMEKDIAAQQTVTIGTPGAVNGSCGTADGELFSSTPAASLCSAGSASAVTDNPTSYDWTCDGTGGGTNASCSADVGYDLILSISPPSGGSVNCTNDPVIHGGSTTCTPTASTGYSFVDWSGDCSGATCVLNNVTSSLNPQANFALNAYNITRTVNPSTAGTVTCNTNNDPVNHGDDASCTYTVNAGYTFVNWTGDCTGATCDLVGVTGAKSVTANFTAPTFTITVNTSGSGTASCTPNPVNGGSNSTCTAAPATGHRFTGWSGDCTGNSCVFNSLASDKTVTANFAIKSYSISGTASPLTGGSVSCSGSVSHGSNASCSATTNTGYSFSGWSSCPSASGASCSFTSVTSNQSVTANFTINSYTVSATASPIDAGSVSCISPVAHGSTSSCTAKAAAGYKLTGWSGACSGSSCSIANVTANASVTASFALLETYNVSTSVSPADSGKITCTKDIMEGGTGTCTAKASAGYRLKAWGGDCSGSAESCSLTNVTSAKSVSATFEEANTFTISARMESLTGYSAVLHPKSNIGGVFGASINCSKANPVTINSTVTCSVDEGYELLDIGRYRGWSGGCSRVEGRNCIIENITTDKQITALYGINETSSNAINIHPAGAGSVWCGATLAVVGLDADYVRKNCAAEANPGYTFTGFSNTQSYAVNANFTKQTGTPSVVCTNCNTSTLTTDDTTTQSVSKTSEADAQGNSTESNVSTTTNTQTGGTTTQASVNLQNANGQTQAGNLVITNDPDASTNITAMGVNILFGDEETQLLAALKILNDQLTTTTTVSNSDSTNGTTVTAGTGTTVNLSQTNNGFQTVVQWPNQPSTTVTTTSTSNTVVTGQNQQTVQGAPSTTTVNGSGTTTTAPLSGNASMESTVDTTDNSGITRGTFPNANTGSSSSSSSSSVPSAGGPTYGTPGITTSAPLVPGTTVIVSACCYVPGTLVTFRLSSYINEFSKPGARKTSAGDKEVHIDMGTGELVGIAVGADKQTFFTAEPNNSSTPVATGFESTPESFNLTLSYPAKN